MHLKTFIGLFAGLLVLAGTSLAQAGTLLGPSPYLQASDSPFAAMAFGWFHLEDLEDGTFNTPGAFATGNGLYIVSPGSSTDSVDADDGIMDGSGRNGHSWWALGTPGITFTFDVNLLPSLPTHVGIVWTDGAGVVFFEAFDNLGSSLGVIGPASIPDGSFGGTTGEDHFFGVISSSGISKINIYNTSGGIETDHLQYGFQAVPIPGAIWLLGSGFAAFVGLRRKNS